MPQTNKLAQLSALQRDLTLLNDDIQRCKLLTKKMGLKLEIDQVEKRISALKKSINDKLKTLDSKGITLANKLSDEDLERVITEGAYGILLQLIANNDVYVDNKDKQCAVFVVNPDTKQMSAYDPCIQGNQQKEILLNNIEQRLKQRKTPLANEMLKDLKAMPEDHNISLVMAYNNCASRLFYSARNNPEEAQNVLDSLQKAPDILSNVIPAYGNSSVATNVINKINSNVADSVESVQTSLKRRTNM